MSVEATKNIFNTPKIANEKSPIVVKPNVVTLLKIATKPKIAVKPKIVVKHNVVKSTKIAIEKNINCKIKFCVSEMQLKNILRGEDNTKIVLTWYYIGGNLNIKKDYIEKRRIL